MISIILIIIGAALMIAPATDSFLPRQFGAVILLLVMGYWACVLGSAVWTYVPSLTEIKDTCEKVALGTVRIALIVTFFIGYGLVLMFLRLSGGGK